MKKVSLKDIANELGVSKTTVSFVLNNRGDEKHISKATQARILKLVNEWGYQPNHLAQSLKKGRSQLLGYLVPDISNPFFAQIGRMIEDRAAQAGYQLIMGSTDENPEREQTIVNNLVRRQIDGLIMASSQVNGPHIQQLLKQNYPLVLFDREHTQIPANYILIDNKAAMQNAVERLLAKGNKRIALLSITPDVYSLKQRIQGFKNAMQSAGIHAPEDWVRSIDLKQMEQALTRHLGELAGESLDALVFTNNLIATKAIWLMNRRFPQMVHELDFLSFDDVEIFDYITPKVMSVAQPKEAIARAASNILLQQIKEPDTEKQRILLETKIIAR